MTTTQGEVRTLTPEQTIDALRDNAAASWWQTTACIEVHGPDAASFLDGLCTQAVGRIEQSAGELGLFLDGKAHIISPAVVWRRADASWRDERRGDEFDAAHRFLLEIPAGERDALVGHLKRYRLRSKVSIAPSELGIVRVAGRRAAEVDLAGVAEARELELLQSAHGAHGFERALVGTAERVGAAVREDLAHEPGLADPEAWEAVRIDAGVAGLFDLVPGRMPAEVGGMRVAVSLDAGCYLGQEPVVRLHYRGRANRTLRAAEVLEPIEPVVPEEVEAGSPTEEAASHPLELLPADDPAARTAGQLTTWASHPDGRVVALAVVRRAIDPGAELVLARGAGRLRVVGSADES